MRKRALAFLPSAVKKLPTLRRWLFGRLLLAAVALELMLAAALIWGLQRPVAERAAEDLAALLVLAAQTYVELPPETRAAFLDELRTSHAIWLKESTWLQAVPGVQPASWLPPFFERLAEALRRRIAIAQVIYETDTDIPEAGHSYWFGLAVGGVTLWLGVAQSRMATEPLAVALVAVGLALIASAALAALLARALARPLEQLAAFADAFRHEVIGSSAPKLPLLQRQPREVQHLMHRIEQMAGEVHALLAARTQLLAAVSHDLRTPLTQLRLALELTLEAASAEERARYGRQAIAALQALDALIADALQWTREAAETPTAESLAELVEPFVERFKLANRSLRLEIGAGLRIWVPRHAFGRALGNLVDNALRYDASLGFVLRAALFSTDDGVRRVALLLAAQPVAEQLSAAPSVEELLALGINLETRAPKGLGLALLRAVARLYGWRYALIWVEDSSGSAALLELPAAFTSDPSA